MVFKWLARFNAPTNANYPIEVNISKTAKEVVEEDLKKEFLNTQQALKKGTHIDNLERRRMYRWKDFLKTMAYLYV